MKVSRRRFLEYLGVFGGFYLISPLPFTVEDTLPLRPPGALPEEDFIKRCIRCMQCGQDCPTKAIEFNFAAKGNLAHTPILAKPDKCTLCMSCINICPTEALTPVITTLSFGSYGEIDPRSNQINLGVAQLKREQCILYKRDNLKCLLCYDICPIKGQAIKKDGKGRPIIDKVQCYGCGLCVPVCPPRAISMPIDVNKFNKTI
ncbi:MAG: hypothetical protein APF76_10265 [Desulfitibacter sp. BRH_c19]|nr:MAG: hypothetical protein APF76_10265 [Desulfitibacter sp. BRH_c19]